MKQTVAFYTLGCRVNQYETAAMESIFRKEGYGITRFDSAADIYVINTCTVTAESERKCRQILRRAKGKNPDSIVVAVGCMAQSSRETLEKMPEVDLILGVNHKSEIVDAVRNLETRMDAPHNFKAYEEMSVTDFSSRDRAFIKIQDGCDRFCSYCIIPHVRGRVRSRDPEKVLQEVRTLSARGFREVVLTGIHVASFGRGTDVNLGEMIRRVCAIDEIERVRISSIDPTAFDASFIEMIADTPKLCPHFHISLQSGSDAVLKRMNRRYTTEEYKNVVDALRGIHPDVSVTTDIITGFPGETDAYFEETMQFVETVAFSNIHVFPYSERKGTPAAEMDGVVPKHVREARAKMLIQKAAALRNRYAASFIGKTESVLIEQGKTENSGFTPHFLRVILPSSYKAGEIVSAKIEDCKGEILYGSVKS